MKKKGILFLMLAMVLVIGLAVSQAAPVMAVTNTDIYQSDTNDLVWCGATSGNIDSSGYIVPSSTGWNNAVSAWEHLSWDGGLVPTDSKNILIADSPVASWIWSTNPVANDATYTGEVLFFQKPITIPSCAVNIQAKLYITADNGYYFYVNDDWSGTPLGSDGFLPNFNPTNFYYASDGVNNLGGGTNSVPYETAGNLYPKDAAISTAAAPWQGVEQYDISSSLVRGDNTIQIAALNEHAPPNSYISNPGGLIYKVVVTYDMASFVSLTPGEAYNPVYTEHTVTATINLAVAGVPVTFEVTGANTASGVVDTDASGQAVFSYYGTNVGKDTITAYIDCNGDAELTAGEETIDATKYWFCNFVTGGGHIKIGRKVAWSFGGSLRYIDDGSIHGPFEIVDHANKTSWHCHNLFDSLIFWGEPTKSPPSSLDHAQFTGTFTSNRGGTKYLRVTVWDDQEPGKGFDTIKVEVSTDGGSAWEDWFYGDPISGGTFQIHKGKCESTLFLE